MKTINCCIACGCVCFVLSACQPVLFEPCQTAFATLAYDFNGWCFYDNADFVFNENTYCQSDNELLTVDFDPPYGPSPVPMFIRSQVLQFGCQLQLAFLETDPQAPPISYSYSFSQSGNWSVIKVHFSPATYQYLTTGSIPHISKRLKAIIGVKAWGWGSG